MKKKIYIILTLVILFFMVGINTVKAEDACTKEAAMQMAKILWREQGADAAVNPEENFFAKLTTAGVILNNASRKDGNNWYEKIYNLTDNNYSHYSSYKNLSFESVVDKSYQGEMLYICELVLSGKYTLPNNMRLQAERSIVERWGKVWTYVDNAPNFYDTYFGYSGDSPENTDVFGNKIKDTSVSYFKNKANSLKLANYSQYTTASVCKGLSNTVIPDKKEENNKNNYRDKIEINLDACTNPDVLRTIYFILILIDIVKIIIPIALIIISIMNFSKAIATSDENTQKTIIQLLIKRFVAAVIVFATPWIVKTLMVSLGNLSEGVNFTDCIENANKEKIEELEQEQEHKQEDNNNDNNNNNPSSNSSKYNYTIFIGDSRTVGMCNSVSLTSKEDCTISKTGSGYSWLNSSEVTNNLQKIVSNHPNSYIVINMGTNSSLTENEGKKYATLYNDIAAKYPDSKVVAVSVTQVNHTLAKQNGMYTGINLTANSVKTFNDGLKNNLNSNIMYCDVYSKMENYSYGTPDGVHYDSDTYKYIYNSIQECLK